MAQLVRALVSYSVWLSWSQFGHPKGMHHQLLPQNKPLIIITVESSSLSEDTWPLGSLFFAFWDCFWSGCTILIVSEVVPEVTFGFFLVLFITILASLAEKQSALQRVHLGGLQRAATLRIFYFLCSFRVSFWFIIDVFWGRFAKYRKLAEPRGWAEGDWHLSSNTASSVTESDA